MNISGTHIWNKAAAVTDNPLDQIPEFDRISLRAVLVTGNTDPTEALNAAGIYDPVVLPVILDNGAGDVGNALTPGIRAVLEFQDPEPLAQPQDPDPPTASEPSSAASPAAASPTAPRTAMLPATSFGRPLAPVRPRR
jgi:hypothetical protein